MPPIWPSGLFAPPAPNIWLSSLLASNMKISVADIRFYTCAARLSARNCICANEIARSDLQPSILDKALVHHQSVVIAAHGLQRQLGLILNPAASIRTQPHETQLAPDADHRR